MLAVGVRVLLACVLGTLIACSAWPCHKSAHDEEVLVRGVRDVGAAFARHSVEATLSSGSLLGAVRDGQFIQDDADADLDVCLHPAGHGLPPGVGHKQALLAWLRNNTQFRAELERLGWEQSTFRPDRLLPVGLGGYRTSAWGIAKVCTKHFLCRPPRIDMLTNACPLALFFPSFVSPDVSLPVSRAPSATRFHPRVPKYVAEFLDMSYGGDWHIPKPQLPLAGCGITQRWLSMWVAATLLLDALLVLQRDERQAPSHGGGASSNRCAWVRRVPLPKSRAFAHGVLFIICMALFGLQLSAALVDASVVNSSHDYPVNDMIRRLVNCPDPGSRAGVRAVIDKHLAELGFPTSVARAAAGFV